MFLFLNIFLVLNKKNVSVGQIHADANHSHAEIYNQTAVLEANPDIRPGGFWLPEECIARHKVSKIQNQECITRQNIN